ncbi:MAG: hypothetical protein V8T10_01010 [Merdibacter sp.]
MNQPDDPDRKRAEQFHPQIRHVLVPCRHMGYTQKLMEILPGSSLMSV